MQQHSEPRHDPAQRHNLYAEIHKGMRAMMAQTLAACGRADWLDALDSTQMLAELRGMAAFCAAHLEHENGFIHPALEARQPQSASRVAAEHVEHEHAIDDLLRRADLVEHSSGAARVAAGEALYRALAVFVADNLLHMQVEETAHNAVLWTHYSDDELFGIHHTLVASLSPHESQQSLYWMLPNVSHGERVAMLGGMRANAPAPVYEGALAVLRSQLSVKDWAKLEAALAAPAPLAA